MQECQNVEGVLKLVDEQSKHRIIDAIEQALKTAGVNGFEDAEASIEQLSQLLYHKVRPLFNRATLDQVLETLPQGSREEQMMIAIAENLPAIVGVALQMFSSHAAKVFPSPNSGRPRALTSDKQRLLCEYVGSLHAQGIDLKTAKKRAGQKYEVSLSTVERTWSGRKKGHKPSLPEVLDFLTPKKS